MVKTAKFTKDSPEWEFFAWFYKFCEKYYEPINDVAYWANFNRDCNEMMAKMKEKGPRAYSLAECLIDGYIKYLDGVWGEKRKNGTNND